MSAAYAGGTTNVQALGAGTSFSIVLPAGAGDGKIVVWFAAGGAGAPSGIDAATFNGSPLTAVEDYSSNGDSTGHIYSFYADYTGLTPGNSYTLTITPTNDNCRQTTCVQFLTGAASGAPTGTNHASGDSTSPTTGSVTGGSGGIFCFGTVSGKPITATSNANLLHADGDTTSAGGNCGASTAAGGSSATGGFTTGGDFYTAIGWYFADAGGGGGGGITLAWLRA